MSRLVCILFIAFITLQPTYAQKAEFIPQTSNNVEIITPDNASRLEHLATLGRGTINNLMWSPDDRLLAVNASIGIWIYEDLAEAPFLIEGRSTSAVFDAAWKTVAIYNHGNIDLWNLQTRQKQTMMPESGQVIESHIPHFLSADGSMLYVLVRMSAEYGVIRWDVTGHQIKDSIAIGSVNVSGMRLSPRGDALFVDRNGSSVVIQLNDTLEMVPIRRLENDYQPVGIVFHPSEPIVAYFIPFKSEAPIYLFNYRTQQDVKAYSIPESSPKLFFSPQGEFLLAYSERKLYRWDLETDDVRTAYGDTRMDNGNLTAQFSEDGRYLTLDASYRSEVWDLKYMGTISPANEGATTPFDQDGTLLAIGEGGRRLLLSPTGKSVLRNLWGPNAPVFSPSNEKLALIDQNGHSASIYFKEKPNAPVQVDGYGRFDMLGFSSDGLYLITSSPGEITFWERPFTESISVSVPYNPYYPIQLVSDMDGILQFSASSGKYFK